MTDTETMLVRVRGGDVIRRSISSQIDIYAGDKLVGSVCEAEFLDDEMVLRVLGDPLPLIVKIQQSKNDS